MLKTIPLIVSFWFFLIAGLHGISLAEKIREEKSFSVQSADFTEEDQQIYSEDPVKGWEKKEVNQWTVGGVFFLLGAIILRFGGRRGVKSVVGERSRTIEGQPDAELRVRESRYQGIVEDQTELICRFREDGRLTFVNGAYCRYFQKTSAELLGSVFYPLIPDEYLSRVAENIKGLSPDNPIITYEHQVIAPSGDFCWHQWTTRGIFDEQGQIIEFQAVGRDVTPFKQVEAELRQLNETLEERVQERTTQLEGEMRQRERVEKSLRENQGKYQRLIEGLPVLIYQFSQQRGGIYYSTHVASVLGYSLDYLYDHPWLWNESIHPQDQVKIHRVIEDFAEGKDFATEYRIQDAEGKWHWFYDRSIGRQEQGEEIIIEGVVMDITDYKNAQLALSRAYQRLNFHLENSPLAVMEWDAQHHLIRWSPQAQRIFGWREGEVLGKNWQDWHFVYEEDLEKVTETALELLEKRATRNFCSNRNYRKDGSVVECEWYNSVLLDELGQVVSLFSLVLDVSDRNEAQRKLKEQTERLQTILDNIPVMIGFLEEDSQVQWVNQEWVNVLGWSVEEMREIDIWAQFYPDPEDRARVINYIQEAASIWKDFQTRTREGKMIETSWANVQLSDGSIIGIGQDITERKQRQKALEESERKLRTLISNLPGTVYRSDVEAAWRMQYISENVEELTGHSQAEFLTPPYLTYSEVVHPEDYSWTLEVIETAIATGKSFELEYRIITATGTEKWVWEKGRGVYGEMGECIAIEGFIIDITARKKAEEDLQKSEAKYRLLFEANPHPLWVYDLETLAFLEVNQAAIECYGYSRQEFLGMTIRDIRPPEDVPVVESYVAGLHNQYNRSGDWRHQKKNGEIIDVEIISHGIEFAGRKARLVMAHDITERLRAQKALQESEERFRRGIIDAPLPSILHAEDGEILQINRAWTELTGYTSEDIPTIAEWTEKAYGERKEIIRSVINVLYDIDGQVDEGEFTITTKSGEERIWNFSSAPLGELPDHRRLIISMALDITERKQAEEELRRLALHDHLTGLPNRNLFMDRLEQAIKRTEKQDHYLFAVLLIDLDRFKVVNDSLGHDVGDQLLVAIARRLTQCVSPPSTVARFGGDEFVILLENLNTWGEATQVAERISEQLRASFILEGREFFTSASIGITFASSPEQSAGEVLRNADIAMYRAKERGKARYTIFDPVMHAQVRRELEIDTNLRLALERKEFLVYYQPVVCLMTQKLIGFEALVRWQHPEKGLVSPAEFIPIAEETGLILPLGEWVLRESCRQMKAWQEQFTGAKSLKISVNLSGRQLEQAKLLEKIEEILEENQLDGRYLNLEITESLLMKNPGSIKELLLELRERNILISIDDFGTGYSSLSYLHFLPVNTLKIDRSFVGRMSEVGENFEIVEAIVTLAHHLNMTVVAEGVETEQHLEQLKALGCEYGQGYYFSKPLPPEEVVQWIVNS